MSENKDISFLTQIIKFLQQTHLSNVLTDSYHLAIAISSSISCNFTVVEEGRQLRGVN